MKIPQKIKDFLLKAKGLFSKQKSIDFLIKHKTKVTRVVDSFVVGVFLYNAYISMRFAWEALPLVVVMFPWVMNGFLFSIIYWIAKDKKFFDETMGILKQELKYIGELQDDNIKLIKQNEEIIKHRIILIKDKMILIKENTKLKEELKKHEGS